MMALCAPVSLSLRLMEGSLNGIGGSSSLCVSEVSFSFCGTEISLSLGVTYISSLISSSDSSSEKQTPDAEENSGSYTSNESSSRQSLSGFGSSHLREASPSHKSESFLEPSVVADIGYKAIVGSIHLEQTLSGERGFLDYVQYQGLYDVTRAHFGTERAHHRLVRKSYSS
jgi:hypothetical protein